VTVRALNVTAPRSASDAKLGSGKRWIASARRPSMTTTITRLIPVLLVMGLAGRRKDGELWDEPNVAL